MNHSIFRGALAVLCTALVVSAVRGEEETAAGVKLLRPDSLAGWEHGPEEPAHWIISDGRLTGNAQSTPLLSGWTFGDFALRFRFSSGSDGAWTIGFPDVPAGPGLRLTLKEGPGCGALSDGETTLSDGELLEGASGDAMHTAEIRRFGGTLSVIVDGRVMTEARLARNRRFGLSLEVPSGEAALDELRLEEPRGNPLFNGVDLDGWQVNNKGGTWTVDQGHVIPVKRTRNNYLRTDRQYANFTFSFEYLIEHHGNSGVAIRTHPDGWPSGDGMELQLLDHPGLVADSTMGIYGNLPPLARADRSGEWNRVVIKADGRMITAWINGQLQQQVNTAWLPEVKHRHLKGWIGVQDHGSKVRFRDLYVHEAPAGLGLDAWYAERNQPAAYLVLDRLMNSERLSRDDGLGSGVVSNSVPAGGQHVVAELEGPGALVRFWQSMPTGLLSFYFDGEAEPRIKCHGKNLFHHVPGISGEAQPTLCCLPFARGLKIVVDDPVEASYRLDYVTFPESVPIESYSIARTGIPRGMLEAIGYRRQGMAGGKLREAEIYERINTEPRTVEPGTTVELVSLPGAGLVNWLRLNMGRAALENEDLWLEVTIDGEAVPAIAAPARFLFPALGGSPRRDTKTLALTAKGGFANLLAMPYGAGITIAARNRGEKPIEKVGISMSVDRAAGERAADYAGRMRLRGVFQSADSLDEELVERLGRGRWIGFVYEPSGEAATGIAALELDGRPQDAWQMTDLDPFWGRPGEQYGFYRGLSGRGNGLAWRYMLMAPPDFDESLVLKPTAESKLGSRLALFYLAK